MRTEKELLELLLREFKRCKNETFIDNGLISYSYKNDGFFGFCYMIDIMRWDVIISEYEYFFLRITLENNKPQNKLNGEFWFNVENKELSYTERVEFLENLIEKYK